MSAYEEMPIYIKSIQYGWLTIKVRNIDIYGSYIDYDIPFDWLKCIRFSIKNNLPFCLNLDGEDSYTIISAGRDDTYVYSVDNLFLIVHNINYLKLAESLYNDLIKFKQNVYDWFEEHIKPDKYEQRKKEIDALFDEINSLLLLKKI